jgi:hypothetical protein
MSLSTIVRRIEGGKGRPLAPTPCLSRLSLDAWSICPISSASPSLAFLGVLNRALIAVVRQKEEASACTSKGLISNRKTDRSVIREAEN